MLFGLASSLILTSYSFGKNTLHVECDDCKYDLKFIKTINDGDDSKYELKCKSAFTSFDLYIRKNGNWEKTGSSKQYEKCDLIKEMCDCK